MKELVITVYLLKCLTSFWILVTKYLIFLQTVCDFQIFVSGGFVTNAKVHQGFRDDKKIEKHCSTFNTSSNIIEQKTQSSLEQ